MDFYKVCFSVLDVLLTCRLLYDHGYNQERTEKKRKNLHSSIPIDGVSRVCQGQVSTRVVIEFAQW